MMTLKAGTVLTRTGCYEQTHHHTASCHKLTQLAKTPRPHDEDLHGTDTVSPYGLLFSSHVMYTCTRHSMRC